MHPTFIFYRSIDRYLRGEGYPASIMTSPEFETSRSVLNAKRKELKSLGMGNRPNKTQALTPKNENQLWETGSLSDDCPEKLQRTLWFLLTKQLGISFGIFSCSLKSKFDNKLHSNFS